MEFTYSLSDDTSAIVEELRLFHDTEWQAYCKLVETLGFDPKQAMEIVALWNWLTWSGYAEMVHEALSGPEPLFLGYANETLLFLNFLQTGNPFEDSLFHFTPASFHFILQNQDSAFWSVDEFVHYVFLRAFGDLIQHGLKDPNEPAASSMIETRPSAIVEELRLFHDTEWQSYCKLVETLGFDPKPAMEIVALWNWLKFGGFAELVDENLSGPEPLFLGFANETLLFLNFLRTGHLFEDSLFHFTPASFHFILENHDYAFWNVDKFVHYVFLGAFGDLIQHVRKDPDEGDVSSKTELFIKED